MSESFTISPTGLIIEYNQGSIPSTYQPLGGFVAETIGEYPLTTIAGQGTLSVQFTTGTPGTARAVAFLVNNGDSPTRFLGIGLGSQNQPKAWLQDKYGTVIGHFSSPAVYPAGVLLQMDLSWSVRAPVHGSRYAAVRMGGSPLALDWSTNPLTPWDSFVPASLLVGSVQGSGFQSLADFNGVFERAQLSSTVSHTLLGAAQEFAPVLSDTLSVSDAVVVT